MRIERVGDGLGVATLHAILLELRDELRKRIRVLDIQTVQMGRHTPAHIKTDLQDAHRELEKIIKERTGELSARVEELAVINSVQEGLAAKLDINAIYELVGKV